MHTNRLLYKYIYIYIIYVIYIYIIYIYIYIYINNRRMEDLFKNVYVVLGTKTSGVCLIKSQGLASSVPFNAIEMV